MWSHWPQCKVFAKPLWFCCVSMFPADHARASSKVHHTCFNTRYSRFSALSLDALNSWMQLIFSLLAAWNYIRFTCTELYCTILYCTVLYCTVLYCTVLYCTVLYCTVLSLLLHISQLYNYNNTTHSTQSRHSARRPSNYPIDGHFLIDGHARPKKMFSFNSNLQALWCFLNISEVVIYFIYCMRFQTFCLKDAELYACEKWFQTPYFSNRQTIGCHTHGSFGRPVLTPWPKACPFPSIRKCF
jgi:hypothetical protein